MEDILSDLSTSQTDPSEVLRELFEQIRPRHANDIESAGRNLQALCFVLGTRPDLRANLRSALFYLLQNYGSAELFASSGIPPHTGFFPELFRRIGHKLLPGLVDHSLLRTQIRKIFHSPNDYRWVVGVGTERWLQLMEALRFDEAPDEGNTPGESRAIGELLRSMRVISYWIAAAGMEPELIQLEPSLETHESPFIAQNTELTAYIARYAEARQSPDISTVDDKHLRVFFAQCRDIIERVRKHTARDGTSIHLTYCLQRLLHLIERAEQLLDVVEPLRTRPNPQATYPAIVGLLTQLIIHECQRNNLRQHWREHIELIALRITENSRAHGEHYITETRSEYAGMARSAMVGGSIIAFMAVFKILIFKAELPPLTGALAHCLNYGLGFCLIHILHGTVATKQPAMTANAIAASIDETGGKLRHLGKLTELIARTFRSQFIAVIGNISTAVPLAGLLVYLIFLSQGEHLADADKAAHLLSDQSITQGGSLFYAAIAGCCLFMAGLVSGYFDNYATYNRIPERILQLTWPKRVFGESRMYRVSLYIGDNLGALAGNFIFGFLLGGTTIFGVLFGLPVDIRHVTLSSAMLGIAFVSVDFSLSLAMLARATLDIAAIGFLNLTVSFALALNVALRARQVAKTPWRQIVGSSFRHLLAQPRDFFLPPKKTEGETPL